MEFLIDKYNSYNYTYSDEEKTNLNYFIFEDIKLYLDEINNNLC